MLPVLISAEASARQFKEYLMADMAHGVGTTDLITRARCVLTKGEYWILDVRLWIKCTGNK